MDQYEKAVAEAFKKALKIVQKEAPADTHSNSIVVAAASLTPILIEVDIGEDTK